MTETQAAAPIETQEQIQAEITSLRSAPFGAGESQLDRSAKIEAAYKKLHAPEAPGELGKATGASQAEGQTAPEPVSINWQDPQGAEIPQDITEKRSALASWFGRYGIAGDEATTLVSQARQYEAKPLSDEAQNAAMMRGQAILRREWGKEFAKNSAKASALMDAFEREFSAFPEVEAAIAGGLWTNVDLVRFLVDLTDDKTQGIDIGKVRSELLKTNQGSPRYRELTAAVEKYYKTVHGA